MNQKKWKKEWKFSKQASYAFNSIINEIQISPTINRLLKDPHFQELVQEYGFKDIKLVQPLAGLIRKNPDEYGENEKFAVYDYIKSDVEDPSSSSANVEFKRLEQFTTKLTKLFKKYGIQPNDLLARQFILTGPPDQRSLNLIDIEGFVERK